MGFFDKLNKKGNKRTSEEKVIINRAKDIVNQLGVEKVVDAHRFPSSHCFHDHVYEGYGFKITLEDPDRYYELKGDYVTIYFNKERVFDNDKFIRGKWEKALEELQNSIYEIKDERRKEKELLERKHEILSALICMPKAGYGPTCIGDNIKVYRSERWAGSYDHIYDGSDYKVYKGEKLVFDAYSAPTYISDNKYKVYVPGSWEDKVIRYSESAQVAEQQRQKQKRDDEAEEAAKILRKLRGRN
ncbi:MAG: hypothetical protein IK137_04155 [Bacilli bacterium]|nr:hypothetical protein [Bacilli bacterium]